MSLTVEQVAFLELLKASLFHKDASIPSGTNWDGVFDLAMAHCVVALIEPLVPIEHRHKWIEIACKSKARFIQILHEQNELIKLLTDNGVSMLIIKGTAAAMYYPVPLKRTMGDVDFCVASVDYLKACELLRKGGYRFIHDDGRHMEFEKNGVVFELHKKVSSKYGRDIDSVIANGLKHSVEYKIGDSSFDGLPTYENGLVLVNHILQHINGVGIGFRQIIDWMMFVNKELDDDAWNNNFKQLVCDFGLERTAVTITYLCQKWLGLSKDITWCKGADDELADSILEQIIRDGNFGSERVATETVMANIKGEGLFCYLQRAGMINWKSSQKHSYLRPFAWMYQLGRLLVKGMSRLYNGKKIFRNHSQGLSLAEIRKRLD